KDKFDKGEKTSSSGKKLSDDAQKVVKNLETIDSKVKTHENAHKAAGGNLVRGGASYNYESGPDGRQYAVSGEVQIELSADPSNPQATIQKMQQVKRAALAPADPSGQDRAVAAMASSIESQARAELSARNADKPKLNAKLGSLYKNKPAGSELIDGKS
ncbi:MAG TPA: putative metalloprotease CJM1_0395 family protein, partial [Ignavibacteriales bacterium]|nr:putative metalloprotease CJM1_0395 family protein [Ignavibacteriales bacterium]